MVLMSSSMEMILWLLSLLILDNFTAILSFDQICRISHNYILLQANSPLKLSGGLLAGGDWAFIEYLILTTFDADLLEGRLDRPNLILLLLLITTTLRGRCRLSNNR